MQFATLNSVDDLHKLVKDVIKTEHCTLFQVSQHKTLIVIYCQVIVVQAEFMQWQLCNSTKFRLMNPVTKCRFNINLVSECVGFNVPLDT